MHITHVLSSFETGGQERVALELASAQRRRGNRVMAVSLAPLPHGPLAAEMRARGVEVRGLPKGAAFDASLIVRLAKLLVEEHVDVVHTHNPQPLAYGAMAGRLARVAVVHTKHGANPARGRRLWLRRLGGHLAHAYVAVSTATSEIARRNRECPPQRLRIIPNGVDLEAHHADAQARRELRAELRVPDDAWLFGTVGRVSKEKDHALLVRAAGPVLGPRVRLVIVGDGPQMAALRAEARRYAPWVVLTGMRHDVPRVLCAMDSFVLSSRSEGLPLALLEAMATRLPVIATDVGGVAEVLDSGRAGRLVPAGDERALRMHMRELVVDRAAARALGDRALARARDYDAATAAQAYLDLYGELTSAR